MAGLDAAILVLEQPTHIIDNYAIVTEVVVRMGDVLQYLKTPFPDLIRLQHIAIGGDCPATFVDDFVGRLTTGGVSKKLLRGWTWVDGPADGSVLWKHERKVEREKGGKALLLGTQGRSLELGLGRKIARQHAEDQRRE